MLFLKPTLMYPLLSTSGLLWLLVLIGRDSLAIPRLPRSHCSQTLAI